LEDVEFVYDDAYSRSSSVRKRYTEALMKARERVILFSPYYFPDKKFLKALWKARRRGVRVDLLIPFRTDVRIATYAAYGLFALLKKRGVHVHLLKKMMHGKGVIVDNEWAMVGSSNIDRTSFYDNYEANVKIKDKKLVRKLKTTVLGWLKDSTSLENMHWEKRGKWQKFKEWLAARAYGIWYKDN
jgi:cardiolipin synthase A/B